MLHCRKILSSYANAATNSGIRQAVILALLVVGN
jgi:hypothetical protein